MVPPDSTSALLGKRADSSVNWLPFRAAGPAQPKAAATWQTASLVSRPSVRPLTSRGNPAASATRDLGQRWPHAPAAGQLDDEVVDQSFRCVREEIRRAHARLVHGEGYPDALSQLPHQVHPVGGQGLARARPPRPRRDGAPPPAPGAGRSPGSRRPRRTPRDPLPRAPRRRPRDPPPKPGRP